eukprot:2679079-Alexandrium_andersonii.AAC.1
MTAGSAAPSAAPAAAAQALRPAGAFEHAQAAHEARANLGANFPAEPELMAGQRLPNADRFVLVLSSGGPEHHPTIELVPYGPVAEAAELAGHNALRRPPARICSATGTTGVRPSTAWTVPWRLAGQT